MIALFKHRWNRVAVRVALLSFLFGTLYMLIVLMIEDDILITLGIVFLVFYIPITSILLFVLLINTLTHIKDINEHTLALIIVLLNIPIALLYTHFLTA